MVLGNISWRKHSSELAVFAPALAGAKYSPHGLDEFRRLDYDNWHLGSLAPAALATLLGNIHR